jgi:hypothetical protein
MRRPVASIVRLLGPVLCALLLCAGALLAAAPPALAQRPPADAAEPAAPAPAATPPAQDATPPAQDATPPAQDATPPAPAAPPADPTYLPALLERARAERLWERRLWHVLLHYNANTLWPGVTSEVDNREFFLAPDGKWNPQAELEATLRAMFDPTPLPGIALPAQCAFPARYGFLKEQLQADPARLPDAACPRFEELYAALDPEAVTLVFASYFFNNPASMFGHTFLVLEKRGRGPREQMLNYTLNFGAQVPEDFNFIGYAVKGMFGGYDGIYHLLPYYAKIKEYNDIDKRDLWEYRFRFRPEQMRRLVQHAWEMNWARFDYFFLDENCSYHLLTLLEAADPALRLRDDIWYHTIPSDTVLITLRHLQSDGPPRYRASRRSLVQQKLDAMTDAERDLAFAIVTDGAQTEGPAFQALPPARQALVVDAAIDYEQLYLLGWRDAPPERRAALRALLVKRSRMPAAPAETDYPPVTTPPHDGHDSARVALALGASTVAGAPPDAERPAFAELSVQPAFHEQLSRDVGFPPYSQTTVLRIAARYDEPVDKWRLEQFNVLDIFSLTPFTRLNQHFSWRFDGGWQRNRDIGCEACVPFYAHFGMGFAAEADLLGRTAFYSLAHVRAEVHGAFEQGYRAGLGLSVGAIAVPAPWLHLGLAAGGTRFAAGQEGRLNQGELRARVSFTRNLEAGLEVSGQADYREAKLVLGYYF